MKITFTNEAYESLKKIVKKTKIEKSEKSGPIFGYFDYINNEVTQVITHLVNKTIYSSFASTEFSFHKIPRIVKKFNVKNNKSTKYIGSWHTHPSFSAEPSSVDKETMQKISRQLSTDYATFLIISSQEIYRATIKYKQEKMEVEHEIKKFENMR